MFGVHWFSFSLGLTTGFQYLVSPRTLLRSSCRTSNPFATGCWKQSCWREALTWRSTCHSTGWRLRGWCTLVMMMQMRTIVGGSFVEVTPDSTSTNYFFPTCQVRVVRFYVSCLLLSSPPLLSSSPLLLSSPPPPAQPRPSTHSVLCRTSTTTIHAQCSLLDLNHDHPRPVFPAGPQPRPSTPSVPCRTSTASIHAKRYAT